MTTIIVGIACLMIGACVGLVMACLLIAGRGEMTAHRYQSSRPNDWVQPRPRSGLTREYVDGEGAIQPTDEDNQSLALRIAAAASGVRRVWRWLLAALVVVGVPMLIHHVTSAFERINL